MKKLFLILTIFLVAGLSSCLDNDNATTSDVAPGVAIYNTAKIQANIDTDPLIIALKLNTLIDTADSLGVDYSKAEVVITPEDKDNDVEEETALAVERLFGKNSVTRSGTVWTIDFTGNDVLEKEQGYRKGTVTIETNGYKLEELSGAGSLWEFSAGSSGYEVYYPSFGDKFVNKFDYYYIEPGDSGADSWKVSGQSRAYFGSYTENAANSSLSYTLVNEGGGGFFYNDILSAAFYLTGISEGTFIYTDNFTTRYEATDLKFKPSCYLYMTYGGTEKASIQRSALSIEEYPSNEVKYNWYDATASTPCGNSVEISYNGVTISN